MISDEILIFLQKFWQKSDKKKYFIKKTITFLWKKNFFEYNYLNFKKIQSKLKKLKNIMKNLTWKITAWLSIFAVQTMTFAKWWVDQTIVAEWSSSAWFKTWVMTVVNYFLWFLWLVAMLMIIKEWLTMVTWWDEAKEWAKNNIIALIIWLVIIILAYSIVRLVTDIQV